jgi:hypothetical protein
MTDEILHTFLERQYQEGMALAAASDRVDLVPLAGAPPQRYLARFRCTGLVQSADGTISEADDFVAGIWFRDDHLRTKDPLTLVTWMEPRGIMHPNIRAPFVCLGKVGLGMSLVDIIYQLYEIITYNKVTLDDALNGEAAAWARRNLQRFPVDRRPLKRPGQGRSDDRPAGDAGDLDFDIVEVGS